MNRLIILFLVVSVFLGLGFFSIPQIDLYVSGFLYSPGSGFVLEGSPAVEQLGRVLAWSVALLVAVCLVLLVINITRAHFLKKNIPFLASNRSVIFVLLALGLGPGLVVNGIFKSHWGRARPREVTAFGGDKQFTPAFALSDQCDKNCSFVSGEAAVGFFGITFMFVAQRRRKYIASASIFLGSLVGFARMGVGAHFLSDVVFSGVFTFLVSLVLYLLLLRPTRKEINGVHKGWTF